MHDGRCGVAKFATLPRWAPKALISKSDGMVATSAWLTVSVSGEYVHQVRGGVPDATSAWLTALVLRGYVHRVRGGVADACKADDRSIYSLVARLSQGVGNPIDCT